MLRKIVRRVLFITIFVMVAPGYKNGSLTTDPYEPAVLLLLDVIVNYAITSMGGHANGKIQIFIGSPLTIVSTYINLAIFVAILISLPIIIRELIAFVRPALSNAEFEVMKKASFYFAFLFLLGSSISFFIILPLMLKFLVLSGGTVGGDNLLQLYTLSSVLSLLLWGTLGGGLLYASPMILVALVNLGILEPDTLKEKRREIFLGIFTLAAVITPDPTMISMTILSVPLVLIVEAVIIWSYGVQLKRISTGRGVYYG